MTVHALEGVGAARFADDGGFVSAAPAPTVWLWHEEGMPDSLPGLAERLRMEGFALQLTDGATLVTKGLKPCTGCVGAALRRPLPENVAADLTLRRARLCSGGNGRRTVVRPTDLFNRSRRTNPHGDG